VEKYGRLATPTIIINDKVFVGFRENQTEIKRMLKEL
jgi:protein-disulfide isomerase